MLMKHLLELFAWAYFAALIAVGSDYTRSRSWLCAVDTRKIVFQAPWTQQAFLTMLALLFLAAALFPLIVTRFPIPGIVIEWPDKTSEDIIVLGITMLFWGGLAQLILSISASQYLEIDLEQRTYCLTYRKWLLREKKIGDLEEFAGIYCSPKGTLLFKTRQRPSMTCGTLGMCRNSLEARAEVERYSALLNLPVLESTWQPFP